MRTSAKIGTQAANAQPARRMSAPSATPSMNAKSAYATPTNPEMSKFAG